MCEVPVSWLMGGPGSFRPAQLCAMSKEEMRDALDHAAASGAIQFSAFSHSFELLSRDRTMANRFAVAWLTSLCQAIAGDPRITSGGFAGLRSEERRVGKECVSTCRSRWSPYY